MEIDRADGLKMIKARPEANLGWRIVLHIDGPGGAKEWVQESVATSVPLCDLVSDEYRAQIKGEAGAEGDGLEETVNETQDKCDEETLPSISFTTFEGSKGLSAQHVFIVGLQNGDLPRSAARVDDIEICKFVVDLTGVLYQAE
jgi:hypothetical protein